MSKSKVISPIQGKKRMSSVQRVIGNWMLKKAEEFGRSPIADPTEVYEEAGRLEQQLNKFFIIKDR